MPFSLRLALRYLFSPQKGSFSTYASWLAISGISIGIAALMLTSSIIHGFQQVISEKLASFDGNARIQHIFGEAMDLSKPESESILSNASENLKLVPYIRGVSMIRSGVSADGILIEGVKILPKAVTGLQATIGKGEIILGGQLAQDLDIDLGDRVFLQVFSSEQSQQFSRKIKTVLVKDIFHSGLQEYDKTLAYLHIDDARNLFGFQDDHISGIVVNGRIPDGFEQNINYPFYFETWQSRHSLLFDWINVQQWPAYVMFGLIALVGIVNLIAAIAMIIIEKSGQVGILMAQGSQKSSIRNIFLIQGGFIGFFGGMIGGLIAFLIIFVQKKFEILEIKEEIYFMDQIPFAFNYPVFSIILILAFLLCILGSWWPTKNVMKLKPTNILRYE